MVLCTMWSIWFRFKVNEWRFSSGCLWFWLRLTRFVRLHYCIHDNRGIIWPPRIAFAQTKNRERTAHHPSIPSHLTHPFSSTYPLMKCKDTTIFTPQFQKVCVLCVIILYFLFSIFFSFQARCCLV